MRTPVPGRFVLGWAGLVLAFEAGTGMFSRLASGQDLEWGAPLWWAQFVLYAGAMSFGEASLQSLLLRRFGRPVRRWTAVVGGGEWATAVVVNVVLYALRDAPGPATSWMHLAGWISEDALMALISSAVILTAVWGFRWQGAWFLWITARVGLTAAVSVLMVTWPMWADAPRLLQGLPVHEIVGLARRALIGAATAWLLWRFVLPPVSPEPGRT